MRKLFQVPHRAIARCGVVALMCWAMSCGMMAAASAKEAQWIWSPAYEKELAPEGTCYFRKTFTLAAIEHAEVQIGCDDNYELFVNGRRVGTGQNWKLLEVYPITKYLVQGANTIAVKGVNSEGGSAGLVARVLIKQVGGAQIDFSTDATWKTTLKEFQNWQKPRFDDSQWLAARAFGPMGMTLPWGNEVVVAGADARFKVTPEFHVEWVADPKDTGPLICMTFDEFGRIIAARENGSLVIVSDQDKDGVVEAVSPYCEELKNCQGLLAVSGKVYAVGEGPQGAALYRLSDDDHDGQVDNCEVVLKFAGEMGEHGPHALTLGPDGLIYMLLGNFAHTSSEPEATSPYHDFYEGDLVQPRYEDAGGHAVGIKAPGGTILRTDTEGSAIELFAGGLQNPYDLAFNEDGELFTCDSDMEWDSGMPWYRPTRVNHVSAGAEFGWRSGWAKWPNYFIDSLPPALEMGRGSPAGMEVYNHYMYPKRFHNALFVCDWSRGRILTIRTKQHGATYKATAEVFLEGQPLNATDITVGPDGWLYFCTGGRDTEGGIYRVVWDGKVPPNAHPRGKGIFAALEQPQPNSAWGRQRIARVKQQMGEKWGNELAAIAESQQHTPLQRARALDLLQMFGPYPSPALLVSVSRDRSATLRARAAYLMGLHADESSQDRLAELLDDKDFTVARISCEAMARSGLPVPVKPLLRVLTSPDRHLAFAAGRALQRVPRDQWESAIIKTPQARAFITGSVALLGEKPDRKTADAILERASALLSGYLTDQDFTDLLRVMQLALLQGEVPPDDVADLRDQLSEEFPSRDPIMNRELVRLLVYLQDPSFAERLIEHLGSDVPNVEKMQLIVHAPFLHTGWTTQLKLEMLQAYEEAREVQGGHSFAGYIENVSRDFFANLTEEERQIVLADGVKWPTSALSVLAKMPDQPSPETLAQIQKLDRQVKKLDTEAAKRLRIGICAVLGGSQNDDAMAYLRELYEAEPDRRVTIAMSLAQKPEGENWPLLVRSLSIVEGSAAQEVLMRLAQVDQTPEEPEAYRQVILRGLLLGDNGSRRAVDLLEKWTGKQLTEPDAPTDEALAAWQGWFVEEYPDLPEPKLPRETEQNHWTTQELLSFLTSANGTQGVAKRGALLFEKVQCAKCHRYGERGETVGPDLTNVSKRFQKKEILESILFPSQVISDQYASQTIITKEGATYVGMVAPSGDGSLVVLQANGEKEVISEEQIEERSRNKVSAMPDGLLNSLTLEEVADLFAYLASNPQAQPTRQPQLTKRPAGIRQ